MDLNGQAQKAGSDPNRVILFLTATFNDKLDDTGWPHIVFGLKGGDLRFKFSNAKLEKRILTSEFALKVAKKTTSKASATQTSGGEVEVGASGSKKDGFGLTAKGKSKQEEQPGWEWTMRLLIRLTK